MELLPKLASSALPGRHDCGALTSFAWSLFTLGVLSSYICENEPTKCKVTTQTQENPPRSLRPVTRHYRTRSPPTRRKNLLRFTRGRTRIPAGLCKRDEPAILTGFARQTSRVPLGTNPGPPQASAASVLGPEASLIAATALLLSDPGWEQRQGGTCC